MSRAPSIRIVEVGPRDGLQNEAKVLTPEQRAAMIEDLAAAGLTTIEAGSFVPAANVPQMAGTGTVLSLLGDRPNLHLPVLVPNLRGFADAEASKAREIAIFASASETFSRHNLKRGVADSLDAYQIVAARAIRGGMRVRGYVSCVLGCPYEGQVAASSVLRVASALRAMGCYEISLGDTIGAGTPDRARDLARDVANEIGIDRTALHFHDTFGQALANVLSCLELGVSVFDASVGGLGGCPYAPGASGNLATEDLVYLLNGLGLPSGIDIGLLARAGAKACAALGTPSRSRAGQAILANERPRGEPCMMAV